MYCIPWSLHLCSPAPKILCLYSKCSGLSACRRERFLRMESIIWLILNPICYYFMARYTWASQFEKCPFWISEHCESPENVMILYRLSACIMCQLLPFVRDPLWTNHWYSFLVFIMFVMNSAAERLQTRKSGLHCILYRTTIRRSWGIGQEVTTPHFFFFFFFLKSFHHALLEPYKLYQST